MADSPSRANPKSKALNGPKTQSRASFKVIITFNDKGRPTWWKSRNYYGDSITYEGQWHYVYRPGRA